MIRLFLFAALLGMAGCVKAVTSTVGAAANVGAGAVKTTANVSGYVVEASFSGDENENHQGRHDNNPRPFDASRNAMMDVDAALAAAEVNRKNVLLVLGGNWCHDSRGLAAKFEQPELAAVIEDGFVLVWVDVGRRDRNLDVAARFGVIELFGTPTVLVLSPEGMLLNRESVHDWRTADSKPYDETLDYFKRYAAG
ncbi:thioredoxin family protein [Hyphococcus flavus]|uniref:Thioredoxin family protein n=1 Tax=Hyphococcus flavus TaxID=1866326 RepID=A0AAF0CHX7_9PROT|nr:thioredoxin family protein [Hyphococcus flavus]WDI32352.1 thioredoxin family protein [Hyphococcus flavus]